MTNIAFVRGAFLNNFEGQNFIFKKEQISIHGYSSLYPIHTNLPFPITQLPSIADLNYIPLFKDVNLYHKAIKYLANRTLGDSQILLGLKSRMKDYEVVDTADPFYYYSYQLARMRKGGMIKKFIVTYCETIPHNNETVAQKKFIKYFTMSQADVFICHTQLSRRALISEGIDENRIEIVRLGVDLSRFKKNISHSSSDITILFVGRLVPEKGILDLYTAFKNLKKSQKYQNVFLKIVGEGELQEKLEQDIILNSLQKWITLERRSYDDMADVYQDADIFVLSSKRTKTWEEQYGMVLIEAMASGLPIVSTKSGAIPEVVGDAGILVAESRPDDLQEAIMRIIGHKDLRLKMARQSLARAHAIFDSRKTAELIGTIYTRLANR